MTGYMNAVLQALGHAPVIRDCFIGTPVDVSGDGLADALGYDTTGDGLVDSLDTNFDGCVDTALADTGIPPPPQVGLARQHSQFSLDDATFHSQAVGPDDDGPDGSRLGRRSSSRRKGKGRRRRMPAGDDAEEPGAARKLHRALRTVFSALADRFHLTYTPTAMLDVLWEVHPAFKGFRQQDASELLTILLDRLEVEAKGGGGGGGGGGGASAGAGAQGGSTFVGRLFGGSKATVISWREPGLLPGGAQTSRTQSPFVGPQMLEIPPPPASAAASARGVPAGVTLEACLGAQAAAEELSGENQYEVAEGGARVDATKRELWHALPRVLCLVLNRTSWVGVTNGRPKKVKTHVAFPLEGLDMAPFCTRSNPHGAAARPKKTTYDLFAALLHHGRSMSQGHYTAVARGGRDGKTWLHFNDDRVTQVSPTSLQKKQAYILFYEARL